jgi:hypothetical protein
MRALTLWAPWGTAMALGVKTIETRSWKTNYRGPVLIHQSKKPLCDCLAGVPWRDRNWMLADLKGAPIPLGAVVAVGTLVACIPTEQLTPSFAARHWGDYSPGRFAWSFDDLRALPEPIYCPGAQGLWEVPEDLANHVAMLLAGQETTAAGLDTLFDLKPIAQGEPT